MGRVKAAELLETAFAGSSLGRLLAPLTDGSFWRVPFRPP